jgi:dipeptidase D
MVCEKNNDVQHDFLMLIPRETELTVGKWLKAKGTTLGADNGIVCSYRAGYLADDSIEHPVRWNAFLP